MSLLKIKDIRKSSIYVTPNLPVMQTRRYKFPLLGLAGVFGLYTLFVFVITTLLLVFTPLKEYIFFMENQRLVEQETRIEDLQNKIILLTKDLNKVAKIDKRLNYAIILAGTDSLDSNAAIYDSLKAEPEKRIEGNIFGGVLAILNDFTSWITDEPKSDKRPIYFVKPVDGFVIKKFDPDIGHNGIDYAVKKGSPIFATCDGVVLFSDYSSKVGHTMIIQHQGDYVSVIKHCDVLLKNERDRVTSGELIALSGNSGHNTTGPHLHFEIWKNHRAIDPEKVLLK